MNLTPVERVILLNQYRTLSRRSGRLYFGHQRSLFSVAARRNMVCPTASRPIRVTAP
jgi:hypothetical protein